MKKLILSVLETGPKTPIELFNLCKFTDPYVFARTITELTISKKIQRNVIIPNHPTVYHSITAVPNKLFENLSWEDIRVEYHLTSTQ
jgi:DNA-binding HxlR family transcriptional regulator